MMKKIDLSKEKIRYVALGDSISEGYNNRYNFAYAGKMNENKVISGTSWPSFLARNIQKINKNFLESYENFAISGSRPEDWNYFLGVNNKKYNYLNSEKKINYAIELNELASNPERKRLKKQFKNFGKQKLSDFDYLIKQIEKANLITLNIGANFLIPKIPIDDITKLLIDNKFSPDQVLEKVRKIIFSVEKDVIVLLKRIKELNPSALVYLVGYNKLYGPFWEAIDHFFNRINLGLNLVEICYDELNNSLKKCSKEVGVYFISTNNKEFWKENNYMLANIFYDIHPTIFGYKKIAQDVLAKISLPNLFYQQNYESIPTFNLNYYLSDKDCFENGLIFSNINIDEKKIINEIYGSKNEILFKKTLIEIGAEFLETNLLFGQNLEDKEQENSLSISFKQSIFTLLNSLGIELNNELQKNLNKLFSEKQFKKFIEKTNLLSIIVNKIQNKLDDYYALNKKELDYKQLINLFFEVVLDFKFLGWVLKEYSSFRTKEQNQSLQDNKKIILKIVNDLLSKETVNNLFKNIIVDLLEYSFINILKLHINRNILTSFVNNMFSKNNINELINVVLDFYFSSVDDIKKINNFEKFLTLFFNDKKIKKFIEKNVFIILKTIEVSDDTYKELMIKFNIKITNENFKIMKSFFSTLLDIFKNNIFYSNLLTKLFINLFINKNQLTSLQNVIDFLFECSNKECWSEISKFKISKLDKNKFNNLIKGMNLLFDNIDKNGLIFNNLIKLTNPKNVINQNGKFNKIVLIKYFDRLSHLKKPLNDFTNLLISDYVLKNKDKNNIYYKTLFRTLLLSLLVLRQLFQKNISINIFIGRKLSIVNYVYKMFGFKNGKNKNIDDLLLNMFYQKGNYNLNIINKNNKNIFWLILTLDWDKHLEETNNKKIFNLLKNGFFEKN